MVSTKAKQVWVIVPFSRPEHLSNVIDNFTRQTFINKKIIIVENGKALGSCKSHGFEPDVLLTSGPHQTLAKNEAINWIRKNSSQGFWATYDDDDYYGPLYLEEQVGASDRAELIGKADFFVRMAGGTLRLFEGLGSNEYVNFIHGPTICSWAELACDFVMVERIGEDCRMVERMLREGAGVWATSKNNFMFTRYADPNHHTWEISDMELTNSLSLGIGVSGQAAVKDFGSDINLDIVNGIIPEPDGYTKIEFKLDIEGELSRYEDGSFDRFITDGLISSGLISDIKSRDKLKRVRFNAVIRHSFRDGLLQDIEILPE